jgi:hypothetical protein
MSVLPVERLGLDVIKHPNLVIPGRAKREPGIQGFPDVQLHI